MPTLNRPPLQDLLEALRRRTPEWLAEVKSIAEIPAPTFDEGRRARHVADRLRQVGVQSVKIDSVGNVVARLGDGGRPYVMVVAHMDTVFPLHAHRAPVEDGDLLRGPGVRDNSAGVAALIGLAKLLREGLISPKGSLYLIASVGEEGLGNLRGVKAAIEARPDVDFVVVVDGGFGDIVPYGVGSVRWRVRARTPGGHSWADYGVPSAVHILVERACRVLSIPLPAEPKTALNIGTFTGGVSVNAIASSAEFLLDLRSRDQGILTEVEGRIRATVLSDGDQGSDVQIVLEELGRRPTGDLRPAHPLLAMAIQTLRELGQEARVEAASTDANIPLARGIPALTIGASRGAHVHTANEFLEIPSLAPGLAQVAWLVQEASRQYNPESWHF
ncbi:M20/M25/M40 family metallo-hydrolase [Geochorda subterranea]|uniref:M20/M25/M40 family metallo-hydrolase n=1 Tax=Geochorda subterranea TaxID=3109564 RepID=A0ABZ1BR15_9FIRM|nr:M20/M25/M40 family metallo-hydrolase [Limnochorda sp. LNt]WRP15249.1 M20/M25/M40 family metallo-hydrolase [Limnochorda sp. LNt]